MILVLRPEAGADDIQQLQTMLERMHFMVVPQQKADHTVLALVKGVDARTHTELFINLPFVEKVLPFRQKYKLVSREFKGEDTVIKIKDKTIGGGQFIIIAGSCSVESKQQITETARLVSAQGATILRGGAFKPRTSPYDFQGLGEEGLRYLRDAAEQYNMLSISEVMDSYDVDLVAEYVDILQIGARNMQNFSLLKHVGRCGKPVLLKRGIAATYHDFLLAAEYIASEGNNDIILCERGIRTFETYTRNTLDVAAVPVLRELTHLPIVLDPSHGTGMRKMVLPMARAAMAVEADGIMIEVHPEPDKALSDAQQTICPQTFADLMQQLRHMSQAVNVTLE